MTIKLKELLSEGILDGITASFAVDSGITESTVKSGRKSLKLPRYSVWGFKANSKRPKLMENATLKETVFEKFGFTDENIYPIEGTMKNTLQKITESIFGDGTKKTIADTVKTSKVL